MTFEQFLERLLETTLYGLQLFAELAVLFVLISFLVGLLHEWLPEEKTRHYLSARHGRGYLIGALIGSATPFCSCSTVPLTLGLLKSGAGFGPTMTLLFTSPLVNPIIVTLFWVTFGIELTLLYTGMALTMAILISWIIDRAGFERYIRQDALADKRNVVATVSIDSLQVKPTSACCTTPGSTPVVVNFELGHTVPDTAAPSVAERRKQKAKRLMSEAVNQFRTFLPHIALGVAIGAFAHGFVPEALLTRFAGPDSLIAIPIAAIIGVPLYVRASTMIPIAMALTAKGMGIGAVIALVIGGAGASLPEVIMLKRMFQWPILGTFLLSVFTIAITTGYLARLLY